MLSWLYCRQNYPSSPQLVASVIGLRRGHCFCCLFYCSLKEYQAIHVRPYERCYLTALQKHPVT